MRKMFVMGMAVLCICSLAFAGDEAKAVKADANKWAVEQPMKSTPLNNVTKMDMEGKRTAMCCCGAEFTVTANAPTVDDAGTSYYMCGEGCREVYMKWSKPEQEKAHATWRTKYDQVQLVTNAWMAGEKKMAKCGCGAEFTVTESAPVLMENGMKMYCCGAGCHEQFMKMSATDRMNVETAMLKGETKEMKADKNN